MTSVGQLHRRLLQPYKLLPFILSVLTNDNVPLEGKQSIARWFWELDSCCLDPAFSRGIRANMTSWQDICPEGKLHAVLVLAFQLKTVNFECETNFARLGSQQAATRGRCDQAANMIAKHMLAECKLHHLKDQLRKASYHTQPQGALQDGCQPDVACAQPPEKRYLATPV